jgi:hypothetical protein
MGCVGVDDGGDGVGGGRLSSGVSNHTHLGSIPNSLEIFEVSTDGRFLNKLLRVLTTFD